MQKSFLSEIKEIPHTYTKINFDTSKIKNIDNIYKGIFRSCRHHDRSVCNDSSLCAMPDL